jgi:DNA-binding NarL/FixJ family response regulator
MSNTFHVSVIDDDPMMREMIIDYFQNGFEEAVVNGFSTGEEALQSDLKNHSLIVLDYSLAAGNGTNMNGLQVLKKLNEFNPALPVIVLSGQDNPEIAASTLKNGAWDYIIKNENTFSRLGITVRKLIARGLIINETTARGKMVNLSILVATVLFLSLLMKRFV